MWVYEKGRLPRLTSDFAGECVEHGYFAGASSGESELEVDNRFAREFEIPFNRLLTMIDFDLNIFDDQDHRQVAALYIAHVFHRTVARKMGSTVIAERMLQEQRDQAHDPVFVKAYAGKLSLLMGRSISLHAVKRGLLRTSESMPSAASMQKLYVDDLDRATRSLASQISSLRWSILHTISEQGFVISDTPIVSVGKDFFGETKFGMGIARAGAEWFFPVSNKRVLRISKTRGAYERVNQDLVDNLNLAQVVTLSRRLYSKYYSSWLDDIVQRFGGHYRFHIDVFKSSDRHAMRDVFLEL